MTDERESASALRRGAARFAAQSRRRRRIACAGDNRHRLHRWPAALAARLRSRLRRLRQSAALGLRPSDRRGSGAQPRTHRRANARERQGGELRRRRGARHARKRQAHRRSVAGSISNAPMRSARRVAIDRQNDGKRLTVAAPIRHVTFWLGADGNGRDLLVRLLIAGTDFAAGRRSCVASSRSSSASPMAALRAMRAGASILP